MIQLIKTLRWLHRMVSFYDEEQSPPGQYYEIEMTLWWALKALGEDPNE